jgi:hypothetical protein
MPTKKAVSDTSTLSQEERMDISHIATSMFAERQLADAAKGKAGIYESNPDSRQLYFKGIHDTLTSLETWSNMSIPMELMDQFVRALRAQTQDDSVQH